MPLTTKEQLDLNVIFPKLVQLAGYTSSVLNSTAFGDLLAEIQGGAAGNGNFRFTGNVVDLVGAAAMKFGGAQATSFDFVSNTGYQIARVAEQQAGFGMIYGLGAQDFGWAITANGIGPNWGGTGLVMQQLLNPADGILRLTAGDNVIMYVWADSLTGGKGISYDLDAANTIQVIASAATIAPTQRIIRLTGTTTVTTVTPPPVQDGETYIGAIDVCVVSGLTILGVAVSAGRSCRLVRDGSTWFVNGG